MYDYHTHTSYSDDCQTPMKDMIASAIQKGALELAITDHYDPDYPDPAFPFIIDFPSYHKDLQEMQENYQKQIKIIKGLEIGIQHGNAMEKCRSQANSFRYDFILGSFHCACGEDLYTGYFDHRSVEKGFEDFYAYMYDCLLLYKDFDILSHFNVIDRYSPYVPDYKPYMDNIEAILKLLIYEGKGIEINTSSFRYGMVERTTPSAEILALYKDLGGELITIGSDAHNPNDIGYMYDWASETLKSVGFKYLSVFEDRQPKQIKL